jgi:hypothetical protein
VVCFRHLLKFKLWPRAMSKFTVQENFRVASFGAAGVTR